MRKKFNWIFIFSLLLFCACEDVIKVESNQREVKLVVDAFVNDLDKNQYVILKRSINYFDIPGTEPGVEGAQVLIVDTSTLRLYTFSDSGKGRYVFIPNKISGDTFIPGRNYLLLIASGNDTFVSGSFMHPTAKVDSLRIVEEDGKNIGIKKGRYMELAASDLAGLGNTYWIKAYRNDSFRNHIFDMTLAYDQSFSPNSNQDGGEFIWPIRYGSINDFQRPLLSGESVRVEVHSITLETFFFMQLIQNESFNGGLFATPPSAIPTNIFNLNPKKKTPLAGFFCMSSARTARRTMP